MRRIGVLQQFDWTIGRNVRIDSRWPAGDSERRSQLVIIILLANFVPRSWHFGSSRFRHGTGVR
jgi:hypothetical protein